jgi:hypothetical protein
VNDRTQSPSDHYASAVRLLAAAESPGVATDTATLAALCAIASTLLASAPRRARRRDHESTPPSGGSPQHRWLFGQDDE